MAASLVWGMAEQGEGESVQAATALALLALAEAGSGDPTAICYWHAAQGFYNDFYQADLTAYGTAGALLEASNSRMQPIEEIAHVGDRLPTGETVAPPERITGPAVEYTHKARSAGVTGVIITELIIGEDGRISHPRVLKGLPLGLELRNLSTLCKWRFKPATSGGKPVKVYYNLVTNFALK